MCLANQVAKLTPNTILAVMLAYVTDRFVFCGNDVFVYTQDTRLFTDGNVTRLFLIVWIFNGLMGEL